MFLMNNNSDSRHQTESDKKLENHANATNRWLIEILTLQGTNTNHFVIRAQKTFAIIYEKRIKPRFRLSSVSISCHHLVISVRRT